MGAIAYEAKCATCGEIFNPAGPDDLEHLERDDGTPCGGPGAMVGGWYSTEAEAIADAYTPARSRSTRAIADSLRDLSDGQADPLGALLAAAAVRLLELEREVLRLESEVATVRIELDGMDR